MTSSRATRGAIIALLGGAMVASVAGVAAAQGPETDSDPPSVADQIREGAQRVNGVASDPGKRTAAPGHRANALLTGDLRDARLRRGERSGDFRLNYSADTLALFRDRPNRTAEEKIEFSDIATRKSWRKTFSATMPTVEAAVGGSPDPVTVKMGPPQALGNGRYQSRVRFPTDQMLRPETVRGRTLTIFANSRTPAKAKQCDVDPFEKDPKSVPNDADFIGGLGGATVSGKRGKEYLRLTSHRPRFFNWFLSDGAGCGQRFTGAVGFTRLAQRNEWRQFFGDINPNSALVWKSKGRSEVFEFEQSRPRRNASGKWVSRIRPLTGGKTATQRVNRFVADHGRRMRVDSPYLFMDSTNSVAFGGETWVVDDNFSITYETDGTSFYTEFELRNNNTGWMGLAFHEFMFPSDNIIAWWDDEQGPMCLDDYNPGIPTLESFPSPMRDDNPILTIPGGDPLDNRENVSVASGSNADGAITIRCQRKLQTGDIFDFQLSLDQTFPVVAAYNNRIGWNDELNALQAEHTAYGSSVWEL